jgi:succinate dehydrogenase/fumarate reductase-like Fe-S protein
LIVRVTLVRGPAPNGNSWEQTYEIPDIGGGSVSDALQYISEHIDGSVAYYLSCRRGLCAACVVRLKGENIKACVVPAYDGIVIERANERLLIKDTVIHLGMPQECEFDLAQASYTSNDHLHN